MKRPVKKPEKLFLMSLANKTIVAAQFAHELGLLGYTIVASGGTKKFLKGVSRKLKVIDTADLTGLKPVLDHRIATLCPELHGGLLAEEKHAAELASLGWKKIDGVFVSFYPLAEKMADEKIPREQVNEFVDIGGPTLVSSACKGNRIVVTSDDETRWATAIMRGGAFTQKDLDWLKTLAAARVARYRATEAEYRVLVLQPQ